MQLASKQWTIPSASIWALKWINHNPGCLQSVNKYPNPRALPHTHSHAHIIRDIPTPWTMWMTSTHPLSGTLVYVGDPVFYVLFVLFSKTCYCRSQGIKQLRSLHMHTWGVGTTCVTPDVDSPNRSSEAAHCIQCPATRMQSMAKAEVSRVDGVALCMASGSAKLGLDCHWQVSFLA